MINNDILKFKKDIMDNVPNNYLDSDTMNMYQYLFNNQSLNNNNYRFISIDFKNNNQEEIAFINLIKDIFVDAIIFKFINDIVIFFFDEIDFELDDLFNSIQDDFSSSFSVFVSGKVDSKNSDNFFQIYYYVKTYLANKSFVFSTNKDLILELLKVNIALLKDIKSCILNQVEEDTQLMTLINAMFDNDLNVTQTAKNIYMHRNTINNKLDIIKRETSLNMQNFNDAMAMYLLIKSK